MAKVIYSILCIFFLACSSEGSGNKSSKSNTALEASKTDDWIRKDACEYLPLSVVSELMGWQFSKVQMTLNKPLSNDGISLCSYQYQKNKLILNLDMNKVSFSDEIDLENQYLEFLKNENMGITFKEIESGDNQAIFGHGKDSFGQSFFIFKKRKGRQMEIEIQMASMDEKAQNIEQKFTKLAQLIEEAGSLKK